MIYHNEINTFIHVYQQSDTKTNYFFYQSIAVNHTAVLNIARAAKQVGAKLVFYSTDYVFDDIPESGRNIKI